MPAVSRLPVRLPISRNPNRTCNSRKNCRSSCTCAAPAWPNNGDSDAGPARVRRPFGERWSPVSASRIERPVGAEPSPVSFGLTFIAHPGCVAKQRSSAHGRLSRRRSSTDLTPRRGEKCRDSGSFCASRRCLGLSVCQLWWAASARACRGRSRRAGRRVRTGWWCARC